MLAMTPSATEHSQIIYIQLLNEGTYVTRPTEALALKGGVYKVLPTLNYNVKNETWEFPPGSVVKCEKRNGAQGEYLLAVEKAD